MISQPSRLRLVLTLTFTTLQCDQVAVVVQGLDDDLYKVKLALWSKTRSSHLVLGVCVCVHGICGYLCECISCLDGAQLVLLRGIVVDHDHKIIPNVSLLVAAAFIRLPVGHERGDVEDGCGEGEPD